MALSKETVQVIRDSIKALQTAKDPIEKQLVELRTRKNVINGDIANRQAELDEIDKKIAAFKKDIGDAS